MTLAHFAKLAVVALFILGAHHSITHNGKLEKQAEFFITPILSTALYFALLHAGGFFSAFQAPQVQKCAASL